MSTLVTASSLDSCQPLCPLRAGWPRGSKHRAVGGPALSPWAFTCILFGLVQASWPPGYPHTEQTTPWELGSDIHVQHLGPGQPALPCHVRVKC